MHSSTYANYDLNTILGDTDYSKRSSKIICTIGYLFF